jgi:CBS domain-containing protein
MNVKQILSAKGSDVATVVPDATLADATAALRDHGVGALVVSPDGEKMEGIISERDVVRALAAHGASTLGRSVSSVMSDEVITCDPMDTVEELMAMMTARRVRHVPVCDGGRLSGIISIGDVVKARLGQLEQENNQLYDYIQGRA